MDELINSPNHNISDNDNEKELTLEEEIDKFIFDYCWDITNLYLEIKDSLMLYSPFFLNKLNNSGHLLDFIIETELKGSKEYFYNYLDICDFDKEFENEIYNTFRIIKSYSFTRKINIDYWSYFCYKFT